MILFTFCVIIDHLHIKEQLSLYTRTSFMYTMYTIIHHLILPFHVLVFESLPNPSFQIHFFSFLKPNSNQCFTYVHDVGSPITWGMYHRPHRLKRMTLPSPIAINSQQLVRKCQGSERTSPIFIFTQTFLGFILCLAWGI